MNFVLESPGTLVNMIHLPTMDLYNETIFNSTFFSAVYNPSHMISYSLILLTIVIIYLSHGKDSHLPAINPLNTLEISNIPRLHRFMENSIEVLKSGTTQFLSRPYKLFCEWGEVTVLPPEKINDIRSNKLFDFSITASDVCLSSYMQRRSTADTSRIPMPISPDLMRSRMILCCLKWSHDISPRL